MSDTPGRALSPRVLVGCLIPCVLLLGLAGYIWWSGGRNDRLIAEIEAAGGEGMQAVAGEWSLFPGFATHPRYGIRLQGPEFDDEWLADHNDLRDLPISHLGLIDTSLSRESIRVLLSSHDLTNFVAARERLTNEDLALLHSQEGLDSVYLFAMPVADDALEVLEGQALVTLGVAGTDVTPAGLQSLRLWVGLRGIWLDGRQLTDVTTDVLDEIGIQYVILSGPEVNDAHLTRLGRITSLNSVTLDQTSVTDAAIDDFRADHPNCLIQHMQKEEQVIQW